MVALLHGPVHRVDVGFRCDDRLQVGQACRARGAIWGARSVDFQPRFLSAEDGAPLMARLAEISDGPIQKGYDK